MNDAKYESKITDIKSDTAKLNQKLLKMKEKKAEYEKAKKERAQTIEALAQLEHDMQQNL